MCEEATVELESAFMFVEKILQTSSATKQAVVLHCFSDVLCFEFFFLLVLKAVKTAVLFSCIFCRMNFISFRMCWEKHASHMYTEMLYDKCKDKILPCFIPIRSQNTSLLSFHKILPCFIPIRSQNFPVKLP